MEVVRQQIHAKAGGVVLRRGRHLPDVRRSVLGDGYCVAPFRVMETRTSGSILRQSGMLHHQHGRAAMAAAAGGRSGFIPATVHVQVRRLQPVLPGARGRASGRAGHHRVLPGGVAVQVRQPPLHAMNRAVRAAWRRGQPVESGGQGGGPTEYAALLHRGARAGLALACAALRLRAGAWGARCRGPRRARARMGGICCALRRAWWPWRPTTLTGCRLLGPLGDTQTVLCMAFSVPRAGIRTALPRARGAEAWQMYDGVSACRIEEGRELGDSA